MLQEKKGSCLIIINKTPLHEMEKKKDLLFIGRKQLRRNLLLEQNQLKKVVLESLLDN